MAKSTVASLYTSAFKAHWSLSVDGSDQTEGLTDHTDHDISSRRYWDRHAVSPRDLSVDPTTVNRNFVI